MLHLLTAFVSTPVRLAAVALLLSVTLMAAAPRTIAARQLPNDVVFVKDARLRSPFVKVDDRVLRLAVGSRIYNEQNLIIMSGTAPARANVLYRTDMNGEISHLWILTDDETQYFSDNPPNGNQ